MKPFLLAVAILTSWSIAAQNPSLDLNNLRPGSAELESVDQAKAGELNIASMNVRDLIGERRNLTQFTYILDRMEGADIIVLQEVGAKGLTGSRLEAMNRTIDAFIALSLSVLGKGWTFVKAPVPTPASLGMGAELPVLFYKQSANGLNLRCSWNSYYELGDKRDMGVFDLVITQGANTLALQIGTVHTKPDCPERGEQLMGIAEYAQSATGSFVVCGDFNWGYKSSCPDGFAGEEALLKLETSNDIFIPFSSISYFGDGESDQFRTNLMVRSKGHMYDQFILSGDLATKMADNASLSKDCGFLSISESGAFEKQMEREVSARMKGVKSALKYLEYEVKSEEGKQMLDEIEVAIKSDWKIADAASYYISDHKPIWMQIKPF